MARNLDDVLKKFQKEADKAQSANRNLWKDTDADDVYNVDIHIWRKTGMGNSIQTIAGNKISIMTATSSYLDTLIRKGVLTEHEFDEMIELVKHTIKMKGD